MVIKILCSGHKDCFANTNGYCTCLMNNDFGGRDCPFYKKKRLSLSLDLKIRGTRLQRREERT